jgi:AcrR family transcriptional regulator
MPLMFRCVTVTTGSVQRGSRGVNGTPADGPASGPAEPAGETGDRRRTRWAAHRRQRREDLIRAAIEAFFQHGPDVDMAQVAAVAGVSKPVLYRYFADKAQLWLAAGDYVAQQVVDAVVPAVAQVREERGFIAATVDAYLAEIESQPDLYRFLMRHSGLSGGHNLVAKASETVAAELARAIGDRLRAVGLDSGPAEPWAYGLVGFVTAVGDWWMSRGRPMSRAALTDYVATLMWQGFDGIRAAADIPGGFISGRDIAPTGGPGAWEAQRGGRT